MSLTEEELRERVGEVPGEPEAFRQLAELVGRHRGRKGEAVKIWLQYVDAAPSSEKAEALLALARAQVEARQNEEAIETLGRITDKDARTATLAERAFMTTVGGGCKTPVGVIVKVNEGLELLSSVLAPDGSVRFQYTKKGSTSGPEGFGHDAALDMLDQGGARLIERWQQ